MGRRTSGQQVGLEAIGNVQASAATLTTTQTNQNLTLAPNGTGIVNFQSSTTFNSDLNVANQGDLRLLEASGNGTNYIAQQAAANMAANYTITWPSAVAGTSGFVLSSDTSGNLSWVSAGGNIAVTDPGSTATVHYPLFGTASGSIPTSLSPLARANLSFVPSTGELLHPILSGASTNSATLTIRGTSSATKATASVLMTDGVASSSTTTGTLVVTGGVGVSGRVNTADLTVTSSPVFPITEVAQTSSYTLALTDSNRAVTMNSGSPTTVTVPPNSSVAFPTGSIVYVSRIGAGTVTLAAGAGVTLTKTGNLGANETILLRKRDTNSWIVDDSAIPLTASGGTTSSPTGFTLHQFTTVGSGTLTVS
jgi:hypothetical protein